MRDPMECYQILNIPPGSKPDVVREAYVNLSRVWDPQRFFNNPDMRRQAQTKRKDIEEAYQTIAAFLPDLAAYNRAEKSLRAEAAKSPEAFTMQRDAHTSERRTFWLAVAFGLFLLLLVATAAVMLYLKARKFLSGT